MLFWASSSLLRMAQFHTLVSCNNQVVSCCSRDVLRRSFSCRWIMPTHFWLRIPARPADAGQLDPISEARGCAVFLLKKVREMERQKCYLRHMILRARWYLLPQQRLPQPRAAG